MQLNIDIETEAQSAAIAALNLSAFGKKDYLNLILQRSEVMFDIPRSGRIIRAWSEEDMTSINAVVERMRDEIPRRAAGVIHAEYKEILPLLQKISPKRIADIGCGYAFFDLFAARDFGAEIVLIDLESNGRRQFGFKSEGAAYSSLQVAHNFLESNGVPPHDITTLNPRDAAPETVAPVDLAVSFLSCGFHFPVDPYMPFLRKSLKSGGFAIFDLRKGAVDEQATKLAELGELTYLDSPKKAKRVLLEKRQRGHPKFNSACPNTGPCRLISMQHGLSKIHTGAPSLVPSFRSFLQDCDGPCKSAMAPPACPFRPAHG